MFAAIAVTLPNIEDASSIKSFTCITLLNKAIAVRNLVSDILTDKEPDLTPFPENVDEFIEEIHRFKSQLKGLGYTVVNTE